MTNNQKDEQGPVKVLYTHGTTGQDVRVTSRLPTRARHLDVEGFHNLQRHHNGYLDVSGRDDGIWVTRVLRVGIDGAEELAREFGDAITLYLGFATTPVPVV